MGISSNVGRRVLRNDYGCLTWYGHFAPEIPRQGHRLARDAQLFGLSQPSVGNWDWDENYQTLWCEYGGLLDDADTCYGHSSPNSYYHVRRNLLPHRKTILIATQKVSKIIDLWYDTLRRSLRNEKRFFYIIGKRFRNYPIIGISL